MNDRRPFDNQAALGAFVFVSAPIVGVCFYVAAVLLATHGDLWTSTLSTTWLLALPILVLWGSLVYAIARVLDLRRRTATGMTAAAVIWTCISPPALLLVGEAIR